MKSNKINLVMMSFCLLGVSQNLYANQIPCSELLNSMIALKSQEDSYSGSVNEWLGELSVTLQGWYDSLSVHEGQTSTIPVGQFSPIQDTANTIRQAQTNYEQTTAQNVASFNDILESLPGCLK